MATTLYSFRYRSPFTGSVGPVYAVIPTGRGWINGTTRAGWVGVNLSETHQIPDANHFLFHLPIIGAVPSLADLGTVADGDPDASLYT